MKIQKKLLAVYNNNNTQLITNSGKHSGKHKINYEETESVICYLTSFVKTVDNSPAHDDNQHSTQIRINQVKILKI